MSRILLLRPGALGDLLLAVPALASFRSRCPDAHITLVGHAEATALLRNTGLVDEGISQDDRRLLGLFTFQDPPLDEDESLGRFDAAVGWVSDREGVVTANLRRLGAKTVKIAPSAPAGDAGIHVADHLTATLSFLGVASPSRAAPYLGTTPEGEKWARSCLAMHNPAGLPTVVLHPGSGSAKKNWPANRFAAVAEILVEEGAAVFVLSGPADASVIRAMTSKLGRSLPILRDAPLAGLAGLLACCSAYLGNDSGITHLAGLVGAPVVALFGPTDPAVWGPRGARITTLWWQAGEGELSPEKVACAVHQFYSV